MSFTTSSTARFKVAGHQLSNTTASVGHCSPSDLIVNELSAQAYADRVLEILADGSFGQLSEFVYNRIKANYTQAVIEPQLREQYEKLANG